MNNYETHLDTFMVADGAMESADSDRAFAQLTWANYVVTAKVNVAAFWSAVKADKSITLYKTVGTWESDTSNARKVLDHFVGLASDLGVTGDDALATAWNAWNAWNDERIANGEKARWSVQLIAKELSAGKRVKAETPDAPAATDEATTSDAAATPLIDVMLANVEHLTADELVRLIDRASARLQLVAVAA